MPKKSSIEQVVEKAVSEVLEGQLARIHGELVARVLQEIEPHMGASPEGNPASLLKAVSAIQAGTTQREILRALLDNAARCSGRVALFVVKAGAATGWQARGFANSEEIKDFALEIGSGIAAQAMQSRAAASGRAGEMDGQFRAHFHAPADGAVLLLPLVLKEKVAALVYADTGMESGGKMDAPALELLVVTASAWLEVISLRKQAAKESPAEADAPEKTQAPVRAPASSLSDPFASQAPAHRPAAAPSMEPPVTPAPERVAVASVVAPAEPIMPRVEAPSAAAAAVAVAPDALAGFSPEDAEIHRKAQRFARLLVDEIKLYNQAKVAEGRKNRDLYDRLKEDIDKSFATYQKRYGNTVAAGAGYFDRELVRSLAEDDISVMGVNFRR